MEQAQMVKDQKKLIEEHPLPKEQDVVVLVVEEDVAVINSRRVL